MLERVKKYYETQLIVLEGYLNCISFEYMAQDLLEKYITAGLAVAQFAQYIGIDYEEVYFLCEEYKEKCKQLVREWKGEH